MFYAVQPPGSIRALSRDSSRRIMTLRFRPAYIRLINRRDSSTAVISPACQKKTGPSLVKPSNGP